MNLEPKITESLQRLGLVDYLLIAVQHGAAIKPASTGPVKRKSDEKPQAPKQLLIIDNGISEILPHLSKGSDASEDLKDLMGKLGFIIYERKSHGKSKPKRK